MLSHHLRPSLVALAIAAMSLVKASPIPGGGAIEVRDCSTFSLVDHLLQATCNGVVHQVDLTTCGIANDDGPSQLLKYSVLLCFKRYSKTELALRCSLSPLSDPQILYQNTLKSVIGLRSRSTEDDVVDPLCGRDRKYHRSLDESDVDPQGNRNRKINGSPTRGSISSVVTIAST